MEELSLQQLEEIQDNIDEFLFAQPLKGGSGEPWAAGYKKDPQLFKKLIRELILFKRDISRYFRSQYVYRHMLIKYPSFLFAQDADPNDFYQHNWETQTQKLAQIIEKHQKAAYALGLASLQILQNIKTALTPADKNMTANAIEMAGLINQTTQKRITTALQNAKSLNENIYQLDSRLKPIIVNDDRAGLIAENEALPEFMGARHDGAEDAGWQYKTWDGVQDDPAEVCGTVIGETVQMDDTFSNGLEPSDAHIGCRCWEDYSMIPDNPTL